MIAARLSPNPIDPAALLADFLAALDDRDGAVASFAGLARGQSIHGERIDGLFLDHHLRLTEASLHGIAADTAKRFSIDAIDIVHRCGTVAPGEAIVWVAATARHRRAAFDAVDHAMDRLKTDAIFWKREDRTGGSAWIEPTADDHRARGRWQGE